MARIRITGPDGKTVTINAPDGATQDQISAKVNEIKSGWGNTASQPSAAAPAVSRLESAGRGALQGVTFGFSDEIGGGLAAAGNALLGDFNISDNYSRTRDSIREGNRAAQQANPGTYVLGELAGGVALPFSVAKAATKLPQAGQAVSRMAGFTPEVTQAATFGQRVGQGVRMGGAYGAAYGAGLSEADSVGGVALDTAKGAGVGALVGGVAVPAVDAVSAVGRAVAAPIRARSNPKGFAAEKANEALTRDMKAGPRLEARARVMAEADPDTMIADVGGTSTQRLIRAAQNQQSPQNEVFKLRVDQRQKFQANKIERNLREGLRLGADDYYQSIDDVSARLKDIGDNGFKPALAVETPMTPQLAAIFERPTTKRLMEHVKARLADEGKPIGFETRTEALHRVKIELNKLIKDSEQAQKMGTANGWDVNSLRTIKRDLMNAWDNDAYKKASIHYADEAALKTAAREGMEDFKDKAPWQAIRKKLTATSKEDAMSDAEKAMYRRGAIEHVTTMIREGNPMGNKVLNLGSDNMQARLRQLFPDRKEWREFQKALVTLSRQSKTRAAAQGNSTTAQQLSDMADSTNMAEAGKTIANAATGNWRGVLDAAGRYGNRALGMTPEVADEVLRILSKRPGTFQDSAGRTINAAQSSGARARNALQTPEMRASEARLGQGQQRRNALARGITTGATAPLVGGFGPRWER
jgi:hypothetical protein